MLCQGKVLIVVSMGTTLDKSVTGALSPLKLLSRCLNCNCSIFCSGMRVIIYFANDYCIKITEHVQIDCNCEKILALKANPKTNVLLF